MFFKRKKKFLPAKDFKRAKKLIRKLLSLRLVKVTGFLLLCLIIAPIVLVVVSKPKTKENIQYGVTFSKKYATELGMDWKETYIELLDDLHVKNIRLITYWDDVESKRDIYNYTDIRWQLEEARKRDVKVVLTLGYKVPRWPECFAPQWWDKTRNESVRDQELYEYVKHTVTTLKPYENIVMWQVENEPFFPFGKCKDIKYSTVKGEVSMVKSLDNRPVVIQDSGEGGLWLPSFKLGDYLAISMYRKIWYDFWGLFFGHPVYFTYPLAHWTYRVKANLVGIPYQKIIISELQAEPWGPQINSKLTTLQKNRTMSRNDFLSVLTYAQKSGFSRIYLWGAEWWLWEKDYNNNPFYWNTAKALFN